MAGRIRDEDIAEVREKSRIDDVVSGYVTLRNAGGGSMKGLCPFHDEKSASFHVTPSRGFFHCFGCGEGGDVINFLMKIDGLTFTEAVERLADKLGIQLRREDGDAPQGPRGPARGRLVEAHKAAQLFYAEQLATPDALMARQFLAERQFDREIAERFGIGFAPRGRDQLYRHLRALRFSDEELVTGGLVGQGRGGGHYDRFEGRLLWPIRDGSRDIIGFGARKLFDDDRIPGKYINTSETPIYKKNQVLYGLDLARDGLRKTGQAVVVEGYTDVMACHLAGVTTAVASCGTAFTPEHSRVLRRFIADFKGSTGEVIFTFDGDAAGQAAAMKVFSGDQDFVSQTYVAVAPEGLDPCDLRIQRGDQAVRDLIAQREPLYRFVLSNVIARHDLDRADGRVNALREAAGLVSSIRDKSLVEGFTRELSSLIGIDVDEARVEVRRAAARAAKGGVPTGRPDPGNRATQQTATPAPESPAPPLPNLRDPRFSLERETLKLVLQFPAAVANAARDVTVHDFTHPTYAGVWVAVAATGGPAAGAVDPTWASRLRDAITDPFAMAALSALAVEPVLSPREPDTAYVVIHVNKLLELTAARRIADLKSRLQRTSPGQDPAAYNRMFQELMALEQRRRTLREGALGM